jgi:small subunit ribosomal protein S19
MNKFDLKKKKSEEIVGLHKTKVKERSFIIIENLVGVRIEIYNGLKYIPLEITENMVGQRLGEFSPTRKKPVFKKKK